MKIDYGKSSYNSFNYGKYTSNLIPMKSESYFKRGKRSDESQSETEFTKLPSDANPRGNVFGDQILKHIDLIANLVASRHATIANTVTASIDKMTLLTLPSICWKCIDTFCKAYLYEKIVYGR